MKFKEGMSIVWKRNKSTREGPALRRTCSESGLSGNEWVQRLRNSNKAETRNHTSGTLRRSVKVEHSGHLPHRRTELIPVKSCLRLEQQDSPQSTSSQNCKRVTFSMYALILSAASQNSVSELTELLDKKPSYINKPSSSGETALHKAAAWGSLDCVKLLVQRGANVNIVDKQGRTPLFLSWESGHFECHKYMLRSLKLCDRACDREASL